jgi:hypothetical protein
MGEAETRGRQTAQPIVVLTVPLGWAWMLHVACCNMRRKVAKGSKFLDHTSFTVQKWDTLVDFLKDEINHVLDQNLSYMPKPSMQTRG